MNRLLNAAESEDAPRRHLAALPGARPLVETAGPLANPRADSWRKRFARRPPLCPAADAAPHAPAKRLPRLLEMEDAPSSDRSSPRTDPEPTPLLELRAASKVVQPRSGHRAKPPARAAVLGPLEPPDGSADRLEIVGVRITCFAAGWDRPAGAADDAARGEEEDEDDCVGEGPGGERATWESASDFGEDSLLVADGSDGA
jgi:hypothetical protein